MRRNFRDVSAGIRWSRIGAFGRGTERAATTALMIEVHVNLVSCQPILEAKNGNRLWIYFWTLHTCGLYIHANASKVSSRSFQDSHHKSRSQGFMGLRMLSVCISSVVKESLLQAMSRIHRHTRTPFRIPKSCISSAFRFS